MDITKLVCSSNETLPPSSPPSLPPIPSVSVSPLERPPLRPSASLESLPCPISSFSSLPIPSIFHQKSKLPTPLVIPQHPATHVSHSAGPLPTPSTLASLSPAQSPPTISPATSPLHPPSFPITMAYPHHRYAPSALCAAPTSTSNLQPQTHHQPSPQQQRVECSLCGKSFSGISSHNRHVSRTHQKARPFSCNQCGLQFGQKGSLDRHTTAVHLKVKPFSCNLCNKSFGRKDNMKIHMTTVHLKKKPYKCDMCPKSFGGKRPLNIHRQTVHFKQRPLKCTCCDKRFGQKSNLNVHMKVHMREGMAGTTTATSVPTSPIGSVDEGHFPRLESMTTNTSSDGLPAPAATFAESSGFASSPI